MIHNISALVSKDEFGRTIEGVMLYPDRVVATNSFTLIERMMPTGVTDPISVLLPKGIKTFDEVTITGEDVTLTNMKTLAQYRSRKIDGSLPEYKQIIPSDDPVLTIKLNPKLLIELCKAFKDHADGVEFKFWGDKKPVQLNAGDLMGLIMPILK